MSYQVFYTDTVKTDLAEKVAHLRDQRLSDAFIERWFNELFDTIDSLYQWPLRFPIDEAESKRLGYPIRKVIFRNTYVIRYRVDETNRRVYIISFVHGAKLHDA